MFEADATMDIEKSRELLWQENRQNFASGAYGDPSTPVAQLTFWQNMERAHYPFANDNVERIKAEIARQNEIAQYQKQVAGLQGELETHTAYEGYLQEQIKKLGGSIKDELV